MREAGFVRSGVGVGGGVSYIKVIGFLQEKVQKLRRFAPYIKFLLVLIGPSDFGGWWVSPSFALFICSFVCLSGVCLRNHS